MKVVLLKDVTGSGKVGDVVSVKSGHARNYLIPKGMAIEATPQALSEARQADAALEHKVKQETDDAEAIKNKIDGKTVKVDAQGGDAGKLFGSVTTKDIKEILKKEFDVDVERKKIVLEAPIKSFGTFDVKVRLHKGVIAIVNLVVKEEK